MVLPPKNAAGIATFLFGAAGVGEAEDDEVVIEGLLPGWDRRSMGMSPVSSAMSESSWAAKAAAEARVMTVSPTVTYLLVGEEVDGDAILLRLLPTFEVEVAPLVIEGTGLRTTLVGWGGAVADL